MAVFGKGKILSTSSSSSSGGGKSHSKKGRGILSDISGAVGSVINKSIDLLPVELHIPGYSYCGPGTKLAKRLARNDPGVNKLDEACKKHDIAYANSSDTASRAVADRELAERAWSRVTSSDAGLLEKAAALAVTNIMKAKSTFGGGMRRRRRRKANRPTSLHSTIRRKRMRGRVVSGRGIYLRRQPQLQPYMVRGRGGGVGGSSRRKGSGRKKCHHPH
ncbi:uncharacterized protein LOC120355435 [Nilaparvata lugens]|uniref:uncharacterized protein LOC120355435 n=1 Tax=Nilaparvata lugens TaxID=108931 RepID=UPI00193CB74C|nr:uncharacterized protein LOC120355435 [Nilaparvata lugens]